MSLGESLSSCKLISADSHVLEPVDLWAQRLPATHRSRAPQFPAHKLGAGFQHHPGGHDPDARLLEMAVDGVAAEVLYPTLALSLFGLDDAVLQQACFRAYNDWLIEYCSVAPGRLVGVAAISVYDIDDAVRELERCRRAGLRGALVWQSPHEKLPFSGRHYDQLWTSAQYHDMPISLHILTGHGNSKELLGMVGTGNNIERYRRAVNLKLMEAAGALFDLIFYGALDRHPNLKVVTVENEIGWMPFLFQQWEYYCAKFRDSNPAPLRQLPTEYLKGQVYGTFFNDRVGARHLDAWGKESAMWSNDFPHPNSTWPNSRATIADHLGHLSPAVLERVVCGNAAKLYAIDVSKIPTLAGSGTARQVIV